MQNTGINLAFIYLFLFKFVIHKEQPYVPKQVIKILVDLFLHGVVVLLVSA